MSKKKTKKRLKTLERRCRKLEKQMKQRRKYDEALMLCFMSAPNGVIESQPEEVLQI